MVLEFVFTAPDPMTVWLVLEHGEVSVCHQHPGFDSDVVLRATTATYSDVFNGLADLDRCGASGRHRGLRATELVRERCRRWFLWSPWADVVRERVARA